MKHCKGGILALAAGLVLCLSWSLQAGSLYVEQTLSASRKDGPKVLKNGYFSIQEAIDAAMPGDTVYLPDGEFWQGFSTRRSGTAKQPIRIVGSSDTVLHGGRGNRVVQIHHSYITLEGFTIDGRFRKEEQPESYKDKLIYAVSKTRGRGIKGVKLLNLTLKNAGGECVRLRYLASHNEIAYNHIENCGVHDFRFASTFKARGKKVGKNGEGIYIGTAPEQRANGKSPDDRVDHSDHNWIHHNVIRTFGNECVDIKEGASQNLVEHNTCVGQLDPKSAGFDARGNDNTFRFNTVSDCEGAGFRLGGDTEKDGINNTVTHNRIENCRGGGVKIQRHPQASICDNKVSGVTGPASTGTFRKLYKPTEACAE